MWFRLYVHIYSDYLYFMHNKMKYDNHKSAFFVKCQF